MKIHFFAFGVGLMSVAGDKIYLSWKQIRPIPLFIFVFNLNHFLEYLCAQRKIAKGIYKCVFAEISTDVIYSVK